MAQLFDITHDGLGLSEYTTTVVGVGCALDTSIAGAAGTANGLAVTSNNQNDTYGELDFTLSTNQIRFRFYVNPNTFTVSTLGDIRVVSISLSGAPNNICEVYVRRNSNEFSIWANAVEDDGTDIPTLTYSIQDGFYYGVEVLLERASSAIANDGEITLFVNGESKENIATIDNYNAWSLIDSVIFGATDVSANTSGTIHIDELEANDDGSEIGVVIVTESVGTIFNIDHEPGDFSQYDVITDVTSSLAVTNGAALASTNFGLHVLINSTTPRFGAKVISVPVNNELRFRFYLDPNSITMATSDIFRILNINPNLQSVSLRRSLTSYQVRIIPFDDAGALASLDEDITDDQHYVEIHIERASTDVSSDGRVRVWIDGVLKNTWNAIDNFDIFVTLDRIQFGAVSGIDVGTSGTLFLDELLLNDDGSNIGAAVANITIPRITTPSHYQSTSLSIRVWKPSISSYEPKGTLIDDSIAFRINSYSHTIKAVGGYWNASFTLNDRLDKLEDWIDRLGYHVEVYSPSLVKIWEGFIVNVFPNVGGLSVQRGPLSNVANRLATVYSTVDTALNPPAVGVRAKTSPENDTTSQGQYGIIEKNLSIGGATQATAEQVRDTWIAENAQPETSQSFNSNSSSSDPGITIECVGYVWFLNFYTYNQVASTGTRDISDILQDVLAADPNTLFSTDYSGIDANTLEVRRYVNDDNTAWNYIKSLVAKGDANDNRHTFGIYNDRKAIYTQVPTDIEYVQSLADPKQRIETLSGLEIKPWEVLPARWLQLSDFLIGRTQPSNLRDDSRIVFLEQVTYTMPWTVSYSGGKVATLDQKLAKLGLGGTG